MLIPVGAAAANPAAAAAGGETGAADQARATASADGAAIRLGQFQPRAAGPNAGLCDGGLRFDRTRSCYVGVAAVEVVDRRTGAVLGTAQLEEKSEVALDNRDRTSWPQVVTLRIVNATGAADALGGSVAISCSACTATGGGARPQLPNQTETYSFTLSSPGNATVSDDQVPQVTLTSPLPNTTPGTGNVGPAATVRCDNTPRMSPVAKGGCVYPKYTPTYVVSTIDRDQGVDQVAWHIWWAQNNLKNHWGWQGHGPALTRTLDQSLIRANRRKACPSSIPRPRGKSCDEYPFASTHQGASKNPDFSCHMVPRTQNTDEGRDIRLPFYNANRLLENDPFWVHVVLPPAGERAAPATPFVQCPG